VSPGARYGLDAPGVVIGLALGGLACLVPGMRAPMPSGFTIAGGVLLAEAVLMVWSSRVGKRRVLRRLVDELRLDPEARALDVGCGRGLLLIELAKRLPQGRAVGVDVWRRQDQSGNSRRMTLDNAEREGVASRVKVHDGDARRLPFDDGCFDAVTSSLVVHNIRGAAGRRDAVAEMTRVLGPGGRLAIVDFRHTAAYARELTRLGLREVRRSGLRFGIFPPVRIVTARKRA
jgi:ubiquinone/menaquinone biosynthesis C-methylase UbiE